MMCIGATCLNFDVIRHLHLRQIITTATFHV